MKPILILLVLLILSVAGNWIQWRSAEVENRARFEENARAQQKAGEALAQTTRRDSVAQRRINKLLSDSLVHAKNQRFFRTQANASRARIPEGPKIVQDTVIIYLDSLVADISQERDSLYLLGRPIIDSLKVSNSELKAMFVEEFKRNMKLEGRINRERDKVWSLGISGGLDYLGRPTINVGIHRSLFRFSLKKR